jgi:hypothetical protein
MVFAGLSLLLLLVLSAVASVLIQPVQGELAETTASLNVPAPKLWAVPLLQRPIGPDPRLPGVVGTRTAMLSLLAIWLITMPCAGSRLSDVQTLRWVTRWISVILFGLAFGTMLAGNGIWPSELPPFRLVMVGGIELPAAALLYAYLRVLASKVPGRERREQFERLAWFVPGAIAVGAGLLAIGWWQSDARNSILESRQTQMIVGAVYGTIAMACGVAAIAAVASLAGAYFQLGFPDARRSIVLVRSIRRRVVGLLRRINAQRARRLGIAAGLILILLVLILGNDQVLWMSARRGIGGNIVYFNFPGPKIFTAAMITEMRGPYEWQPLISQTTALALELLAVWLITIPLLEGPVRRDRLRRWFRWGTPLLIGGSLFAMAAVDREISKGLRDVFYVASKTDRTTSEFFAALMLGCEFPLTLLLYAMLGRLARELDRPGLGRQFLGITLSMVGLLAMSGAGMALSRHFLAEWHSLPMIAAGAVYGALAFGVVIWATATIVKLIGALLMETPDPPGGS